MDGLGEDVDVVFLLTTNRADLLEPALASPWESRPGRRDPLPAAGARRALIELYRGDLELDVGDYAPVLARTAGVTASFLKELLRRAAMVAIANNGHWRISVSDLAGMWVVDEHGAGLVRKQVSVVRAVLTGADQSRRQIR